ncbi:hypothetical protein WJX81_000520 [Elliptochloris bilobata]|uniref:F-box domain-containing protein n=1 Tax=Elliptochloris bilobata TaxID=381761 RepID=A0AAW1R0J1_9CHLO
MCRASGIDSFSSEAGASKAGPSSRSFSIWVDVCRAESATRLSLLPLYGAVTPRAPSPLDLLPEELLHEVFRQAGLHLGSGTRERCRLSTVCRSWRQKLAAPYYWQAIELNTAEFRTGSAFADALLSLAPRACPALRTVRVVAAIPGRPKRTVLYGGTERLCMYRGARLGFSAAARELEAWLLGCQQRLAAQARRAPSRADSVWRKEYDVIEEVMCGKRFRQAPERGSPEWTALAAGVARTAGAATSACLLVVSVALWTRLLGWLVWPAVLALATVACNA